MKRHTSPLAAMAVLANGVATLVVAPNTSTATASPSPPAQSTIGGQDLAEASTNLATSLFPTGADTVYLAQAGSPVAFAAAAANASKLNAAALSAAGTDANDVGTQIRPLSPTKIELVGAPSAFPSGLVSALETIAPVSQTMVSDSPEYWSAASHDATARESVVVANTSIANSVEIGVGTAIRSGASLIILDSSESEQWTKQVFKDPLNEKVILVGGESVLVHHESLSSDLVSRLGVVSVADRLQAEYESALVQVELGANLTEIVAAKQGTPDGMALAALRAQSSDSVSVSIEGAGRLVPRIAQAPGEVSVVGTGATNLDVDEVRSFQRQYAQPQGFRVTDTTVSQSNFSITVSDAVEAAEYRAYDNTGALVAKSDVTSIQVPMQPRPLAVTAVNSSGVEVASAQYKVNDFEYPTAREEIVIGSGHGSIVNLTFLGGSGIPRIVERVSIDPFAPQVDPIEPDVLGITCVATFTDISASPELEHHYLAKPLSTNTQSCGGLDEVMPDSSGTHAGLTVPATDLPVEMRSDAQGEGSIRQSNVATRSIAELALDGVLGGAQSQGDLWPQAAGDDWAPVQFRYQAYIPHDFIYSPGFTGDFGRPLQYFGGDNRRPDPKGSFRYRQDVEVRFGSGHNIIYQEAMGETTKYKCRWPGFTDCVFQARDTAPLTELDVRGSSHGNTWTNFTLWAEATNPLHWGAPAISANLVFKLRHRSIGSTIRGTHDLMPIHEIYLTVVGWNEWYSVYVSRKMAPICLATGGFDPTCRARLNIRL